jgi:hypothetical protein
MLALNAQGVPIGPWKLGTDRSMYRKLLRDKHLHRDSKPIARCGQ